MDIDYTREFKGHLRKLGKRYRSIREDIGPVIEDLRAGQVLGDRIAGLDDPVYKVRVKK